MIFKWNRIAQMMRDALGINDPKGKMATRVVMATSKQIPIPTPPPPRNIRGERK